MNNLILLLTSLVCAYAAPQFVFVLPPEFLQQIQKPVGEASQPGQQPPIPFFSLESLLGSSSILAESIISTPVVPESLLATNNIGEAAPVEEVQQQKTTESAPVVVTVAPTINAVAEVALALAKAQEKVPVVEEAPLETTMTEEVSPVVKEAPIEETLVEEAVNIVQEAVNIVQEAPVEAVIMEEVIVDVQETPVDTPVQEVTSDHTIAIQNVVPVEEMVAPFIVEKVTENLVAIEELVVVQDVNTNTAEEVIIIEEVIPSSDAATTQSAVATTYSPVPSINSAPVNQVVDPRMSVDPRFRNYIYVNDAPDVVAAKIAFFNIQAASLPAQQVL